MKIVLTGAGGGHFYPLIAVAEKIKEECIKQKILDSEFYFFSDAVYNEKVLFKNKITFIKIISGKMRTYFSLLNIFSPFLIFFGFIISLFKLFTIYPDVVFAKGGYSSLPVLLAARILFIPIFVHESDSVPGRTTRWAGRFAKRVAISYTKAVKFFPVETTAYTGQPIEEYKLPSSQDLINKANKVSSNNGRKNILILGGSQGSQLINDLILESLTDLLEKYDVIHQVGENNFEKIKIATEVILKNNLNAKNYHYFSFSEMRKYFEIADLCITRAGSTLFELSAWGIPSIIIPITNSNGDHQRENAYTFEKAKCGIVIEEINFKKNLFLNKIDEILNDKDKYMEMRINNLKSFKPNAAEIIAKEIVKIGLSHNY